MTAHHIVPPYLLEHLEWTTADPNLRARCRQSLQHDGVLRTRPAVTRRATHDEQQAPAAGSPKREVYDAENGIDLPGRQVRAEGEQPVQDAAVNEATASPSTLRNATFADFAQATRDAATELYGADSSQLAAVRKAWQQVGVEPVQQIPESADLMRAANLALGANRPPAPSPPAPTPPAQPGMDR
jgi:hypothetical protein